MALLTDGDQGHRDKLGSPSSATNIRAGKQRMAYVLLPRLSRRLHIAARSSIQSTHFNESENTHSSQVGPSTSTSTNALVRSRTAHSDADDDEFASMSDGSLFSDYTLASDYSESNRITTRSRGHLDKEELFAKIAGGKRPRDDDEDENGASNNSGVSAVRSEAKRRKQSRKTDSEQDHSADEDEAPANPLPSGPMPEISASSSASKAVNATRKHHRKEICLRQWSNLSSRVTIIAEIDRFRFIFDGHECRHSSQSDLDPSSTSHSDSPVDEFDDGCAALEAFNMAFYKPLNMVFCQTHRVCIPLTSLISHISSLSHTKTLPRTKGVKEMFLSHVTSAFDLPTGQTFHSQGSNATQLPKPIPSMEEPRIYLQCPFCQTWINQTGGRRGWKSHGVVQHLKRPGSECARLLEIPESERPALKECYGQRPCGPGPLGHESHIPFVQIVGWNPTAASSPPIQESENPGNLVDPSSQEYAKCLKWTEYFPQETAECLRFLCMLPNPSQSEVFDDPISHQNRRKILERGLHEVHTFLKGYLQEANDFVDSCDPGFRLRLTEGSVSRVVTVIKLTYISVPGRTKSRYNSISDYAQYRHPLTHAVALLLRYKFHYDSGQRVAGKFELPMTKSLNETRIALYEFLLSVSLDEVLDRVTLGTQVHALVVSLLTAKCRVSNRIGHILDITIPMGIYKRDGIYRNANYATQYCAWLQFCLISVAIQASRLGGVEKSYVHYYGRKEHNDVVTSDELCDDEQDDTGFEDSGFEDVDIVSDLVLRKRKKTGSKLPEPIFFVDEPGHLDQSSSSDPSGGSQAEDALLV